LYHAFDDQKTAAKAAGILAIVGVVNLPIIHFSVEWWNTLHQGATITKFEKPSISNDMLWPLLLNIFGFAFFFGSLTMIRLRNEIINKESHRPWVVKLAADKSQRGS
jgi:heme exporter protein C